MITWMISLWANPLARKFIATGGAILAIFWFLRIYGNRQYDRGEAVGRQHMAAEIERQKRAEWKAIEDGLALEAATIATERAAVAAATEQMNRDRAELSRHLRDGLAAIQRERTKNYETIAAYSDDQLWGAIRTLSRQLAAGP